MAEFNVVVTVRLEVSATFPLKARNEEAAEEKAQKLAEHMGLQTWEGIDPPGVTEVEWEETNCTAEVEVVEEA